MVGCAGVVDEASAPLAASLRTFDLWARIRFPRRFVGKLYFVTIRVWGGLIVSLVGLGLELLWGLGFAVGVHCCPRGDAVWKIGWRIGMEMGGSGAYGVWVRL